MTKPDAGSRMPDSYDSREALRAKLNLETAPLPWTELQRHFATGVVFVVDKKLDLIDVAERIASDDKNAVVQWIDEKSLLKVSDEQAQEWLKADAVLWAVVVKPWVLVQEKRGGQDAAPGASA